jgi:hypothetical protein
MEYTLHFKSMSIDNTDELKLNKFETIIFLLLLNRIVCMILFYIILHIRANEPHNTFSRISIRLVVADSGCHMDW